MGVVEREGGVRSIGKHAIIMAGGGGIRGGEKNKLLGDMYGQLHAKHRC